MNSCLKNTSSSFKIVGLDGMSKLTQTLKIYSPLLVDIFKTTPLFDETTLIIPDCPINVIQRLHEILSSGFLQSDASREIANCGQVVNEMIMAGQLLCINFSKGAFSCYQECSNGTTGTSLNDGFADSGDSCSDIRAVDVPMCNYRPPSDNTIKVSSFAKWPSDVKNISSVEDEVTDTQARGEPSSNQNSDEYAEITKFHCPIDNSTEEGNRTVMCDVCLTPTRSVTEFGIQKLAWHVPFTCDHFDFSGRGIENLKPHMDWIHGVSLSVTDLLSNRQKSKMKSYFQSQCK